MATTPIIPVDKADKILKKKDYKSYGYEILWVDRSHQGGVQCT